MKFFNARRSAYHTNPRIIDEVIYTTYAYRPRSYEGTQRPAAAADSGGARFGDLLGIEGIQPGDDGAPPNDSSVRKDKNVKKAKKFDQGGGTEAEIFMFNYGTVVIWGMTEAEEKRFLSSM